MPSQTSSKKFSEFAAWVRHRSVCYLTGRGVLYGVDAEIYPLKATAPSKYGVYVDEKPHPRIAMCDSDLEMLVDGAFDFVLVGPRLATRKHLQHAVRKLKTGGHLVVVGLLSSEVTPSSLRELVAGLGSWILKESSERHGHCLQIYKKLNKKRGVTERKPSGKPRVCIVRYGALGDMIILTPLVRKLAEDGYEVTLNITPYAAEVIKHNPYVHNIIYQEREAIPNPTLGEYWAERSKEYDRYINLSESLEGKLLKVEGRRDFYTHAAWRREHFNHNYYDWTMQLGGYPNAKGLRGELYFTPEEERECLEARKEYRNKYIVMWALNGSSHHKIYGLFVPVTMDWLAQHREALIITTGDAGAVQHEYDHPQIIRTAGQWPLRYVLGMTKHANLVVGPESMLTNAAGCFDTPKITMLSHSTHENLCKYWTNDYCLAPNTELAPCYPCHQLHYTKLSCPQRSIIADDTSEVLANGPACTMGAIEGERMIARLNEVYAAHPLAS